MLALTLIQPWAWAILHAGKRIENRAWKPPARVIGQRIAVHAGLQRDDEGLVLSQGIEPPAALARAAIVGTARVTGYVVESQDRWFVGPFGWLLEDVFALPVSIPCKGALGCWRMPADVEARVLAQEAAR